MQRLLVLTLFFIFASNLNAFEVLKVRGQVSIDGAQVKKIGKISNDLALVETKAASFIKIRFPGNDSVLTVAPNSIIQLNKNMVHEHIAGSVLFKFLKKKASNKSPDVVLKTKVASFGVRGTEFMSVSTPLLGESEIITFEGAVDFQSLNKKEDRSTVKSGQWGGIGGRYGSEVGKILDLPANVLEHFHKAFNF